MRALSPPWPAVLPGQGCLLSPQSGSLSLQVEWMWPREGLATQASVRKGSALSQGPGPGDPALGTGRESSFAGTSPFLGPRGGLPLTGRLKGLYIHVLYPPQLETNPDNCT